MAKLAANNNKMGPAKQTARMSFTIMWPNKNGVEIWSLLLPIAKYSKVMQLNRPRISLDDPDIAMYTLSILNLILKAY